MEKIIEFFKRLIGLDENFTEQENKIMDIFTKLIDMPNTDKVLVNSNCAYLSNNEMHIFAVIDIDNVIIENENETLSIKCSAKFMYRLSKFVSNSLQRNVSNLYQRMYIIQTDKLVNIDNKLANGVSD